MLNAICDIKDCTEDIFVGCPDCLVLLCYNHRDTDCTQHLWSIVELDDIQTVDALENTLPMTDNRKVTWSVTNRGSGSLQVDQFKFVKHRVNADGSINWKCKTINYRTYFTCIYFKKWQATFTREETRLFVPLTMVHTSGASLPR